MDVKSLIYTLSIPSGLYPQKSPSAFLDFRGQQSFSHLPSTIICQLIPMDFTTALNY